MIGILLYIYFLFVGFLCANKLFKEKDIYYKAWMGGVFGNVLLMAGIVPIAAVFGFTVISHIILAVLAAVIYAAVCAAKKEQFFDISNGIEKSMDIKILLYLIVPITLVIWILMTNHILVPYSGGGVSSGQCTYGDLQMHLGFVTGIAEQHKFPPDYVLLAGEKLNYPFFVDMLSSSLYLFGTTLRMAVLIPSYVISLLLTGGFYIFAYTLTKRKSAAVLAIVFFFINGGFGFIYFLDGAKADIGNFTRIFTDYYHTPTNYNEMNIRWSNTICDMIVPQRTTMAGWCMILPCLTLLREAVTKNNKKLFIILGILAGCMPMIHTHSFLALGIISAVLLILYLPKAADKKIYLTYWVYYGVIAIVMAVPQLFYWTFSQAIGNSSFLNFRFNWVNENDPYIWFYVKNWGIAALLAIPAYFNASDDNRKLFLAGAVIFVLAELIQFQPNVYDNNKLFYISYMIALVVISGFMLTVWDKLKAVKARGYFAAVIIFLGTFSGMLTIIREWKSGGEYKTFSDDDIKMAEYIKENVPSDSVVLTGTNHINPVVTLAGRTVYCGSSLYVYFHGFKDEYEKRSQEIKEAYSSYDKLLSLCEKNNIQYVYAGENERSELNSDSALSGLTPIYKVGNDSLYKVK